jgi:hypothetical protein
MALDESQSSLGNLNKRDAGFIPVWSRRVKVWIQTTVGASLLAIANMRHGRRLLQCFREQARSPGQGLESGDIFGRRIQAHGIEARVVTILRQQLIMGTTLDNPPPDP